MLEYGHVPCSPAARSSRTFVRIPVASFICEATVRFQIRS
jgi:hypothetical protein